MIDFQFLKKFDLSYDYIKYDFMTKRLFIGINVPSDFDSKVSYFEEKKKLIDQLKESGYQHKYTVRDMGYDILIFEGGSNGA